MIFNMVGPGASGGSGGEASPVLPAEYQEVEYMDFDGASYVDTIDAMNNDDMFECYAMRLTAPPSSTYEDAFIGAKLYRDSLPNPEMYFEGNYALIFTQNFRAYRAIGDTFFSELSTTEVKSAYTTGTKLYFMMQLADYLFSGANYIRIGRHRETSDYFRGRLWKIKRNRRFFELGDGTSLGKYGYKAFTWYVPCYRKADGVAGWYDTKNNEFYTNLGTGTFTVGPDVN